MTKAAQAQMGVLAAAMAMGGDESNVQPGIDFFKKLRAETNQQRGDVGCEYRERRNSGCTAVGFQRARISGTNQS